jgi:hypothetical protein
MGKMNQIQAEITEMMETGSTFEAMVEHLQVAYSFPYEAAENWVLDIEADVIMREEREYHEDSDDGYALASAGYGTDEDYGSYSDIEEY